MSRPAISPYQSTGILMSVNSHDHAGAGRPLLGDDASRGIEMAGEKVHDPVVQRFATRLREVRLARGMTQAELALKSSIGAAYIGRLERGTAAPGIDLVERLAHALGTSAAELLPAAERPADAQAVLREQARSLLEAIVASGDSTTLSLAVQVLSRLSQTMSPRE